MSESYETVLEAALRLPAEQQLRLAELLIFILADVRTNERRSVAKMPGQARQHFGAWDSGDEHSADNERIDDDLAREYGGTH